MLQGKGCQKNIFNWKNGFYLIQVFDLFTESCLLSTLQNGTICRWAKDFPPAEITMISLNYGQGQNPNCKIDFSLEKMPTNVLLWILNSLLIWNFVMWQFFRKYRFVVPTIGFCQSLSLNTWNFRCKNDGFGKIFQMKF